MGSGEQKPFGFVTPTNMNLQEIVHTSRDVTSTNRRQEKIERLAQCLQRLEPEEIEPGVALLSGEIRQGRIGIGYAAVQRASASEPAVRPSLTVREVDQFFERIASTRGPGSSAERARLLGGLFSRAVEAEQEYLARLILDQVRQGALQGVMVEALARAAQIPAKAVRRAHTVAGDLPTVARSALLDGATGLAQFRIRLMQPLQPMLAQPAEDVSDALTRLHRGAIEFKLDGARIQVHKSGDEIRVFTRNLNDVTDALPEVVERIAGIAADDLILDGEVIALRPDGKPHPFQTTMRRFGRKLDVDRLRQSLPMTPFFFDCLLSDDQVLIDQPTEDRFTALRNAVGSDLAIPRIVTGDVSEAEAFLRRAIEQGHEGIMIKSLEAAYDAGGRGRNWLKIKPAHTLDLVVLAAEWGSGRRRGWLSNLHLGARDPASGNFVMIGKTFKGLTDKMLKWQTGRLQELARSRDQYTVSVRPELVVEIAFNDVQVSAQYASGMALRFARVKRFRTDKLASQADTIDTVRAILQQRLEGS